MSNHVTSYQYCIFHQPYTDEIIIDEAYIQFLKKVCNIRRRSNENDFYFYHERLDFKCKKLIEALQAIQDTTKKKTSVKTNQLFNNIEEICEHELQNLFHEIGKMNYEIYEEKEKLKTLKTKYIKSRNQLKPLTKTKNKIIKYKIKDQKKGDHLQKLFDQKYFYFKLIQNEFNEYEAQCLASIKSIKKLQSHDLKTKRCIDKINDYFLTDFHARRGN